MRVLNFHFHFHFHFHFSADFLYAMLRASVVDFSSLHRSTYICIQIHCVCRPLSVCLKFIIVIDSVPKKNNETIRVFTRTHTFTWNKWNNQFDRKALELTWSKWFVFVDKRKPTNCLPVCIHISSEKKRKNWWKEKESERHGRKKLKHVDGPKKSSANATGILKIESDQPQPNVIAML